MIIKKFVGKTEEEAVEAAKKELGNSVVIMNVKSVKRKGLFAAFRSKLVEVTVALEDEKEIFAPVRREVASKSVEKRESIHLTNTENIEKKLDSLQTLLESKLQSAMEPSVSENSNELQNSRHKSDTQAEELIDKKMSKPEGVEEQNSENNEQNKFIRLLYNTLIDNGVDEKYANQLLEDIEKSKKHNMPFDYILANVYQKMILKFGKVEGITPALKNPKVIVFIGPTGVGKTTTIAKLASSFAVDEKKKVALLTADTYRIAAAEQLRTYANILEAPFRVVYTPEELKGAIEVFRDFDYIFVDTAGHSHKNEQQLGDMKVLLDSLKETNMAGELEYQCFLVLSATTKYQDLLRIVEIYKKITDYKLIFTKLDETTSLGSLFNVKLAADSCIAYVTCGQNVPDDIEIFNPQKTVKNLLGGKQ